MSRTFFLAYMKSLLLLLFIKTTTTGIEYKQGLISGVQDLSWMSRTFSRGFFGILVVLAFYNNYNRD
jgi:hypothetical protein